MNIYDYVLYGVNEGEYMKNGQKELVIYPTKEAAWGKHINCQIVLLKSYQGEKDVLMFQWWNGRVQFVTLSGMYAFLRMGWTGIGAEDPLAIYAKKVAKFLASQNNNLEFYNKRPKSIFDIIFYGAASSFALERRRIQITTKRGHLILRGNWQHDIFKATVLQSYEGESYVLKLESENGNTEYVQLFNPIRYYNEKAGLWDYLEAPSTIPQKILECYFKEVNMQR